MTIDILASLIDIDTELFLFLNGIHSATFDVIFLWVTSKIFWIPFYILLFFFTALKYRWKTLYIGVFIALLFLVGDQVSVKLFKDVFERLRPCHNPHLAGLVHVIDGCGGQYGFVSSHATNSFALAFFSGLLLKKHYRYILTVMLLWAALVSYSRIYVGVHYPGDILSGAILGSIIGILVFWLMKYCNDKFKLKIKDL